MSRYIIRFPAWPLLTPTEHWLVRGSLFPTLTVSSRQVVVYGLSNHLDHLSRVFAPTPDADCGCHHPRAISSRF